MKAPGKNNALVGLATLGLLVVTVKVSSSFRRTSTPSASSPKSQGIQDGRDASATVSSNVSSNVNANASVEGDVKGNANETSQISTTTKPKLKSKRGPQWRPEDYINLAKQLGVEPPTTSWPRCLKLLWLRTTKRVILGLEFICNPLRPPNSSLSLMCMWWKAMATMSPTSPVHEYHDLYYRLLPRWIRRGIVQSIGSYPRFLQTNIEIRMTYLHRSIQQILRQHHGDAPIQIITFGAGYDIRTIHLLQASNAIEHGIELDMPDVIQCKRRMLEQHYGKCKRLPEFFEVDLNDWDHVQTIFLLWTLRQQQQAQDVVTIFVFEAVLLYLDEGVPTKLLELCSQWSGYLCFADRLELEDDDRETAAAMLERCGWKLEDWMAKPGATRHLGWARTMV
mmetsp:Transcript_24691/g.68764  ORF Transcript_24691/g.68764 Transcript_24691/m.68764 type:complete len:394 (-) Transcript_24691:96-1277(-)